jgi:hypothetical protein
VNIPAHRFRLFPFGKAYICLGWFFDKPAYGDHFPEAVGHGRTAKLALADCEDRLSALNVLAFVANKNGLD